MNIHFNLILYREKEKFNDDGNIHFQEIILKSIVVPKLNRDQNYNVYA